MGYYNFSSAVFPLNACVTHVYLVSNLMFMMKINMNDGMNSSNIPLREAFWLLQQYLLLLLSLTI